MDEPSAGLDPITSGEIDDLLLELKNRTQTTLVIVTHNMPSARRLADRFVMLEGGHVVADGSLADLERSEDGLVQAFMHSAHSG